MSLHIHRFIDLVKATEARGQRDLHMPLRDAKDLHADITRLLVTLEEMRNITSVTTSIEPAVPDVIEIQVMGGSFKTT